MLSATDRIYFKGLNELRAFAALGVIWHHIELYKYRDGIQSLYHTHFRGLISGLGHNGVNLFFVLSGFLITYLLLIENERSGTVHVRNFYIRRILRIWPLYYLIVLFSLFVIPLIANAFEIFKSETHYYSLIQALPDHFATKLALLLFILPNFVLLLKFKPIVGASQSWSIGVEEQFYYLWPWVMRKFQKRTIILICLIWPLKLLLVWATHFGGTIWQLPVLKFFSKWLVNFQIELMSLGGLGAILLHIYRYKMMAFLQDFRIKLIILAGIAIFLNLHFYQSHFVLGFFFCLLILSTTISGGINVNNAMLSYLGKISYGLYMYHPIVMFLIFPQIHRLGISNIYFYNILVYVSVLLMTVLVSHLSFRYFENYFTNLKDKFAIVKSTSSLQIKE